MAYRVGTPITTSVTVTAAQLKSLSTTPVTIIPAPGAGNTVVPISAYAVYHFGTVPFNLPSGWACRLSFDYTGLLPWFNLENISPPLVASGITSPHFNYTTKVIQPFNISFGPTFSLLTDNRALTLTNFTYPGNGVPTAAVIVGAPTGFSILSGGSGYAVNDVFTISALSGSGPSHFTVNSVDSNGAVTSFTRITNTSTSYTNQYFYAPQYSIGTAVNPSVGMGLLIGITSVVGGLNGIVGSNVHSGGGGTGYNNGDTGTIAANGGNGTSATYTVTSNSGGAVTGYTITSVGTGFITSTGVATAKTTGAGTGFTIDITAIGGGYAVGDTGTWGTGGTYTVGTVDASGNVLTLSAIGYPTSTTYVNSGPYLAARGGGQPGVGLGLSLVPTITGGLDPTTGDGTIDIVVSYYIAG